MAESLARTPLMRAASTTGTKVAAGVIAVHDVNKGTIAAKIVAAVPASTDAVILLTNPSWVGSPRFIPEGAEALTSGDGRT